MRYTEAFMTTIKETPAEAETISHKLLLRAGMMRKVAAGIYTFMPLGKRVLAKVEQIVREEMDRAGALEILMPALQPAELWHQTGRWQAYGPELMRLKDRHEREFCLGPTHEELITWLVSSDIRSYRQLPVTLYQIQVKFRDEIRPRFGLMRAREFIMKDAYSFDLSVEGLHQSYQAMHDAYCRIVERCSLKYRVVEAESGLIGGDVSQEFMVIAKTGEEEILYCDSCSYAANRELARSRRLTGAVNETKKTRMKVSTPGQSTIEEVSRFLKVELSRLVKTLVFDTENGLVAVLIRGDKEANISKIASQLKLAELIMLPEERFASYGLVPGFVGPIGLKGVKIVADEDIKSMIDFVVGANEKDAHLINVNRDDDFQVEQFGDFVYAEEGELCPKCEGKLLAKRGIEVGHVFQLGTKYSQAMEANFVDENGAAKPFVMGCYGIGVSRMVAAIIEQFHDEAGIIWPISVAPYHVVIIPTNLADEEINAVSKQLYQELTSRGVEVILDDRTEGSAGVKFADADLIGFPLQAIIGKKGLQEKQVEIKVRQNGGRLLVPLGEATDKIQDLIANGIAGI